MLTHTSHLYRLEDQLCICRSWPSYGCRDVEISLFVSSSQYIFIKTYEIFGRKSYSPQRKVIVGVDSFIFTTFSFVFLCGAALLCDQITPEIVIIDSHSNRSCLTSLMIWSSRYYYR